MITVITVITGALLYLDMLLGPASECYNKNLNPNLDMEHSNAIPLHGITKLKCRFDLTSVEFLH